MNTTPGSPDHVPASKVTASKRSRTSHALLAVGDVTSKSGFSTGVAAAVACFAVALAAAGFPASWHASFGTVASGTTVVMVFVIQHTRSRQHVATQLKLDELIRASPRSDDLLVHIETADDDELRTREEDQIALHTALRTDEPGDESPTPSDRDPTATRSAGAADA